MKQNTIRLYKHYLEMIENPKGADSAERALCKANSIKAKEDLEKHFREGRKYKDDEEIQALISVPKKEVQNKSEEKESGKKSKR